MGGRKLKETRYTSGFSSIETCISKLSQEKYINMEEFLLESYWLSK